MKIDLSQIITAEQRAAQAEAEAMARAQAEARAYLAETDWMVVRFAETGVPVPEAVTAARAAARAAINKREIPVIAEEFDE